MKYFVSNGCSWTFGTGLDMEFAEINGGCKDGESASKYCNEHYEESQEYIIQNRMPTIISKKLGLEDINISLPGKSNNSIVRTTIDWIMKNQDKINDTFFYIQWSSPNRIEFLDTINNKYVFFHWFSDDGLNAPHLDNQLIRKTYVERIKKFEEYFIHPILCEIDTLYDVINLQNFLKQNGCKYIFVDGLAEIFNNIGSSAPRDINKNWEFSDVSESIETYNSLLDLIDKKYFSSDIHLLKRIQNTFSRGGGFIKLDGHPSSRANHHFGDETSKYIKNNLL